MVWTSIESQGDSLAYSSGRGNPLTADPKRAMVYTIGHGLGLTDSQIRNNGVPGAKMAEILRKQKEKPPGGPGSLTYHWGGHNTLRDITSATYNAVVAEIRNGIDSWMTYARSDRGAALVLGLVTGVGFGEGTVGYDGVQEINAYLATKYGSWFFNSWEYLAGQIGADPAATTQAMIDAGLSSTSTDRADIIAGWTPDSIRADAGVGHLNQIGYDTYGPRLVRHINSGGPVDPPPGNYVGSLAASPTSPAPGATVTFTATVTPAPAEYKFRFSDLSIRDYAAGNTATKAMPNSPLTVTLDVKNGAGTAFLGVAALTVQSTPPPASGNSAGLLPFFANA